MLIIIRFLNFFKQKITSPPDKNYTACILYSHIDRVTKILNINVQPFTTSLNKPLNII